MITRLVKFHLCELLYLANLNDNKKIDLWYEWYIMGCTVTELKEGEYNIKLRTIFKASNLTMKDVGKVLTTKAREWYISKLNEM